MRRFLDFCVQAHLERALHVQRCPTIASVPLLRAVRDTERNTEGIGCALSAGVNRRELPSSIQRGKNGKTSPAKCNFFCFLQSWWFGGSGLRPSVGVFCFHLLEEATVGRVTR